MPDFCGRAEKDFEVLHNQLDEAAGISWQSAHAAVKDDAEIDEYP